MAKNTKIRFFNVLYSDKTWVFDQSQRAQSPIYIMMKGVSAVAITQRWNKGFIFIRVL